MLKIIFTLIALYIFFHIKSLNGGFFDITLSILLVWGMYFIVANSVNKIREFIFVIFVLSFFLTLFESGNSVFSLLIGISFVSLIYLLIVNSTVTNSNSSTSIDFEFDSNDNGDCDGGGDGGD